MRFQLLAFATYFFLIPYASAIEQSFNIHRIRSITPNVDRYYSADGGALATLFCRADAAEILFTDARVPALDGKTFYFANPAACEDAKARARKGVGHCDTKLRLETQRGTAAIDVNHCRAAVILQ